MLVATAGHVDHGKTSLVKHLTGTNTDRLAEEKLRGLTIELGYAFTTTQANQTIAFIDVPGHHRFVNTMISGINGIDIGMLVVAADDGPMPQTIEHTQLLRLLGVTRFVGVLTKIDLVDQAQLDKVIQQMRALIPGAPICQVSNQTGKGIDTLESSLEVQASDCQKNKTESQFRMYVDRSFIKKGAGIVATGTCVSGSVKVGDELQLHASKAINSQNVKVRVREIHSQGEPSTDGHAGQRCALNISGNFSLEMVKRGDFLCAHPTAQPSFRLDTRCLGIQGEENLLKHMGRVKLHIGTRRLGARTYLLDRGERTWSGQRVQLILDESVLAFAGDRFVLRNDNESATLGGGVVIDPEAPQWGKSRDVRIMHLNSLEKGRPEDVLKQQLLVDQEIVSLERCKRIWNLSQTEVEQLLALPEFSGDKLKTVSESGEDFIVVQSLWLSYVERVLEELMRWHREHPSERGIQPTILQGLLRPRIPEWMFKHVLASRFRSGEIVQQDQLILAREHTLTASPMVQRQSQQLKSAMLARGLQLPLRSELLKDTGFSLELLESLTRPAIKSGDMFEVGEKRIALSITLRQLAGLVGQYLDRQNDISIIEAKEVFGLGRNVTVEILEFFDQIGFTKRSGNARIIANIDAAQLE